VTDTPSIDDERHLDDRPLDDRDPDDGDWDDYVEVRRETTRGRKVLYLVAAVLAFVLIVGAGTAFWVRSQIDPGSPGDEVAFTVPDGATTTDVANLLEEAGIITNSAIFGYYVRYKGAGPFQAGDYDGLRENSAMGDVITRLEAGPIPPVFATFTIPPGLRLEEVKAAILTNVPGTDAAELDAALAQATSPFLPAGTTNLEGFLFPETYQIELESGRFDGSADQGQRRLHDRRKRTGRRARRVRRAHGPGAPERASRQGHRLRQHQGRGRRGPEYARGVRLPGPGRLRRPARLS
jgi:hypothetical protein